MLLRYVKLDLCSVDLESSCLRCTPSVTCHVIKDCTKFELNWAISGWIIDNFVNFCTLFHAVTLTLNLLTIELLQHFGCQHVMRLKFERNRMTHCWVSPTGDLALFRVQFQGWGTSDWTFSGLRGHNFTKLGKDITTIIARLHFCFRIRISCRIFKRGQLKIEWCWKRRQILHFWDLCTNCWSFTKPRITFDGHPLHGCWESWIDNKEKSKKESSWVNWKGPSRLRRAA